MTHGVPEDQLDLDAYFKRIGYTGDGRPTLATLQAIHLRHEDIRDNQINTALLS